MATREPVPTYAEVSYSFKDKQGNIRTQFNPTWLKWFIDLGNQVLTGQVDLTSQVTGILPQANGGYGVAVPVTPNGAGVTFSPAAGTNLTDTATWNGFTIADIVDALEQVGILT